ncbi:hypothetical protein HY988_06480 [Candidatus Micrarchaeota archaeon]|nr:hypothetical protein [Candidatus Micrarchaeota archaeon]
MPQSGKTKAAWSAVARNPKSLFDFDRYKEVVDFVDRTVPSSSRTILLGGGRGYLGHLMSKGQRSFVNVDLVLLSEPFLPTIQLDIEFPIPPETITRIRTGSSLATVITPFSLEYTEIELSLRAISALLTKGELWIWLCHHSDADIVQNLRRVHTMLPIIKQTVEQIQRESPSKWFGIATAFESSIRSIYPDMEDITIVNASSLVFMELLRNVFQRKHIPIGHLLFLAGTLRRAYEHPELRDSAIKIIRQGEERFETDVSYSLLMVGRDLRKPADLNNSVGKDFHLVEGTTFINPDSGNPAVLVGIFEKY